MKVTVIADAVIEKEGKVLLLKRASDKKFLPSYWDLPGGKVEEKEDPNTAIKREVLEETNLQVKSAKPRYVWSYQLQNRPGEFFIVINYLVKCHDYDKIQVRKEEHSEFKWLTIDEIEKLNYFSPEMKIAVNKVLEK